MTRIIRRHDATSVTACNNSYHCLAVTWWQPLAIALPKYDKANLGVL